MESWQVVQDFMMVKGADPAKHTVVTTYPRQIFSDSEKTLGELGLTSAILRIEPK